MIRKFFNFGLGKAMEFAFVTGVAAGATLGAIAGLAAGFVAATLTVPKSGTDTRSELADKGEAIANNARIAGSQFVDFAAERGRMLKQKALRIHDILYEDNDHTVTTPENL